MSTHNENGGGKSAYMCVCKKGFFLAADSCRPCEMGSYCTGVVNSITPCPTHSTSFATSEQSAISDCICKADLLGEDGIACEPCGPGTYKLETGNSRCIPCGVGRFSPQSERSIDACEDCPSGKFSTLLAAADCTGCAQHCYNKNWNYQAICCDDNNTKFMLFMPNVLQASVV